MSASAAAPGDAIRDAATVVLVRDAAAGAEPRVLMGQRGRSAVFMPSKYVFPGGAVDAADAVLPFGGALEPATAAALGEDGARFAHAAIRELLEETGLALARPEGGHPPEVPAGWRGFFAAGHRPAPEALRLIFRAVTPPGRPRRFDARFFLADAGAVAGDPDDFSGAEDELSHLHWVTLAGARRLDLPFITRVVLGEVAARLAGGADRPVPFLRHAGGRSVITAL
ncbi:MAG TPA: NUDIX hydrolase [Thermohalobaculum sp.]|nr:NUDIX hydrolase [Thermohalobaculum sp.]